MGILEFFRKLFVGKKSKNPRHLKIKHKKPKPHKHVLKHKKDLKKHLKIKKGKIKRKKTHPKVKAKLEKKKPTAKRHIEKTKPKVKYGIPKHHEHEAELKVAEKTTDIDEFYTKPANSKVSLKVMEKGVPEFEEGQAKHKFFFKGKKDKPEEDLIKKKVDKKEEKLTKTQVEKQLTIGKITKILKSKQDQNLIVTNLDMILEIVNALGKVRIDDMSMALKITEDVTEELAKILEENGLIEIHYPPFGKIEFKAKSKEKAKKVE